MTEALNNMAPEVSAIKRVIITAGEPAGVGPDLVLAIAQQDWAAQLVVVACKDLLAERAQQLGLPINLIDYDESAQPKAHQAGTLHVISMALSLVFFSQRTSTTF